MLEKNLSSALKPLYQDALDGPSMWKRIVVNYSGSDARRRPAVLGQMVAYIPELDFDHSFIALRDLTRRMKSAFGEQIPTEELCQLLFTRNLRSEYELDRKMVYKEEQFNFPELLALHGRVLFKVEGSVSA